MTGVDVVVVGQKSGLGQSRRRCQGRESMHPHLPSPHSRPPCNLSLTPVCSFPLHLSLLDVFTLTYINHGRLPENHHLSVGDPHLHLCLLCPVFRGCQGPQDHSQGTQAHSLSFSRFQLLTCFQVYFDVTSGDEELGRIVLGLYGKTVPKVVTCPASIR
jgi:hypothetical protein